ncbi:MAG: glycosyltransferase family 2 protein [Calditrichaceae bacterium]|nr:glycosyltransferase family 2 protein [Calditrichaceae bacterium]MBN2710349.1 glycosyltransferase family 2 protein [Calditrichaceae bacterium]RQV95099.1 MAG: glycosyltransferase family 2 protein [Calditrichota bacterium]
MEKLSVVIITKNEENNIERCLQSISWADEIIVLDSHSTDRTVEICQKYNCRTEQTEWLGFGPTKQKAVNMASNSWILSIDADEEVSPALKDRIQLILKMDNLRRKDGYRLKRQSWYLNKWIKFSGWNKDYPLRLFNRYKGGFNNKLVHESVQVRGSVGKLNEVLYHYAYQNLKAHIDKIKSYGDLTAGHKINEGKRGSVAKALLHGIVKFIHMYVIKGGFLDGKMGLVLAINSSYGVYFKHLLHWEKTCLKNKGI